MPVVTIHDVAHAEPLARALLEGGIGIIEVTLRSPAALDAVRQIRAAVPGMVVGVGTVRTPDDLVRAAEAGAEFTVSPGFTDRLLDAAKDWEIPFLPGAATPAEMMKLADSGYTVQKFFPAGPAGGIEAVKAIGGPLPEIRLCPSGGIDGSNASAYLDLPNVLSVSGSWIAPTASVTSGDWASITGHASRCREQHAR